MRPTGPAALRRYLDATSHRQDWLAGKLRVSQATVSLYLSGDRTPSLRQAARIQKLTGGSVKAVAWMPVVIECHACACMCAECRRGQEGK